MRISDWGSDVCSSDLTGLARFDGVRFTTFTPLDTPALPGAWIRVLRTDASGALWIGTYQGVAIHDEHGFRMVAPPPGMPGPDEIGRASCRERVCQYV